MKDLFEFPEFRPHPLLRSGNLQTLFAAIWSGSRHKHKPILHVVPLSDGDALALHDDAPAAWRPGHRCVLLVHGLTGCHTSGYISRITHKLNARGVRVFRMDMRGCGAGTRLAVRLGHAGRSDDVRACVEFIHRLCPESPVSAAGFSLGGNLLLKLVGQYSAASLRPLDSVMAVAPPIDLVRCSENIRRHPIYDRSFVRTLCRQFRQRQRAIPELRKYSVRPRPASLYEFDDRITAPISGFADAADYYSRSSSARNLEHIEVSTLIIAASDDPLVPVEMYYDARFSASTTVIVTRHGGHVGFLGAKNVDPDRRWLEWRVVDWACAARQPAVLTPKLIPQPAVGV